MGGTETSSGFFARRQPLGIARQHAGGGKAQAEYANVPKIIGVIVGRRLATLNELQTIYGEEDAHNLLEIIAVDSENERE
jgi:hypothetical protein